MTRKIYVCITGDLFHHGHITFLKKAREYGDYLIVGVCSDDDVKSYKWSPILNLNERIAVIECCTLVDEVLPNAPPETTEELIKSKNINVVVATKSYSQESIEKYYKDPKRMGILKLVDYTEGISTSSIVERCAQAWETRSKSEKKI